MTRLFRTALAIGLALALLPASLLAAEPTKVRLGLLPLALHQLPVMVANDKGFYEQERLDVELTIFKGGSEVAPALINGNIDVAQGVVAHPIKLLEKGLKTKILVLTQATPAFVLAVAKKHADVKDVGQFRGRNFKIAIARRGSDSDMMMRAVLAWKKLDPERDVTLVQIPSYANHLLALERGDADASMMVQPFAELGIRQGTIVSLLDFAAGQGPAELRDRPWASLYVTDEFYNGKREVARGIVRATVRGHKLIQEDVEAATQVARKHFPKYEADLLRAVIKGGRDSYQAALTKQRFEAENQYLLFGGLIKAAQPYAALVAADMAELWK